MIAVSGRASRRRFPAAFDIHKWNNRLPYHRLLPQMVSSLDNWDGSLSSAAKKNASRIAGASTTNNTARCSVLSHLYYCGSSRGLSSTRRQF